MGQRIRVEATDLEYDDMVLWLKDHVGVGGWKEWITFMGNIGSDQRTYEIHDPDHELMFILAFGEHIVKEGHRW